MRVFVSYRRQDSSGWAGRLVNDLSIRLGAANVFHDIESIQPADNWFDAIDAALQKAQFVLVVIGPSWLGASNPQGLRRLDDPEDLVRLEVATGLRSGKAIIPVLVGGAEMPAESSLPNELRPLVYRQAVQLTDRRWHDDMQHLLAALAGKIWWRRVLLAGAGALQVTFIGLWIYFGWLEQRMAYDEAQSTATRNTFVAKMQVGTDECMAGTWPEGAINGPTYQENGNQVTELCSRVSGSLNYYFGRFFGDDQLWRSPPSWATAEKFAKEFDNTFNRDFEPFLTSNSLSPPSEAALTLARRARAELAALGEQVVAQKRASGAAAERLQTLQPAITLGKFWTLLMALGVVVWLARGRRRFSI